MVSAVLMFLSSSKILFNNVHFLIFLFGKLSLGGLRQQFSLKENIQMSMFGAEFLRKSKELLSIEGVPPPDIQYHPYGCLYLADQDGAAQLQENWLLQKYVEILEIHCL